MTAVSRAGEPPPDADLLEFIGQWGDNAALIDAANDTPVQDPNSPPPPPVEADDADQ